MSKHCPECGLDIDRYSKNRVQVHGMYAAILFSFLTPVLLYGLLYAAAVQKIDLHLPADQALYVCLANMAAIVAFGFGGPSGLSKREAPLLEPQDNDESEHY